MKKLSTLVFIMLASLLSDRPLHASPESESLSRGETYVQKTCVGCHAGPQLDTVVARKFDPLDLSPLSAFLSTHHVSDEALRADVVAYLRTRLTTKSPEP